MKPNIEATYFFILFIQMAVLFISWWYGFFVTENAPLQLALTVFFLGLVGGVVIRKLRTKSTKHSSKATTLIMGSILTTIGAYFVIVPLIAILHKGIFHSSILILGILLPSIMQLSAVAKNGEVNA